VLEAGILTLLQKYDRAALTPDQVLTAEVYACGLDDRVRASRVHVRRLSD